MYKTCGKVGGIVWGTCRIVPDCCGSIPHASGGRTVWRKHLASPPTPRQDERHYVIAG